MGQVILTPCCSKRRDIEPGAAWQAESKAPPFRCAHSYPGMQERGSQGKKLLDRGTQTAAVAAQEDGETQTSLSYPSPDSSQFFCSLNTRQAMLAQQPKPFAFSFAEGQIYQSRLGGERQ